MKKRILSALITLSMCLTMLPTSAWAAEPDEQHQDTLDGTPMVEDVPMAYNTGDSSTTGNWIDSADTSWYTDHRQDSSFTISTAAELAGLASLVNNGNIFSGKTITLVADIDLSGKEWTPIGSGGTSQFRGTFDGNGKTVSNLYVSASSENVNTYAGLFGYVRSGTVKNLNVSGEVTVTVTSSKYVTIYVGGVVGYAYNTTVENCSFSGAVSGTGTGSAAPYVGGVVGRAYSSGGTTTVKNCSHSGTVMASSSGNSQAGGVVGNAGVSSSGPDTVENCFSSGDVAGSGTNVYVGGVVAYSGISNTVTNCYHTGNVSGERNPSDSSDNFYVFYVGGVVGYAYKKNSSDTPSVKTTAVKNCYFLPSTDTNADLSGIANDTASKGAVPKSAEDFASGAVAYLLSLDANGAPDEASPWRQNLKSYLPAGSTAADAYPTLDGTHLRVTQASGSESYTNTLEELTSEDDAYEIANAAQLYAFAQKVNSGTTNISAILADNIDLFTVCGADIGQNGTSWTPIGNFNGTFDGQGHMVSGLYIQISNSNVSTYTGLFGRVNSGGTVKNLAVSGEVKSTVDSEQFAQDYENHVGGVVGYNSGRVENCSFRGSVSASGPSGAFQSYPTCAGGVVGYNSSGTVTNCYHTGAVTASGKKPYAGGVAAYNSYSGTVTNCYFLQEEGSTLSGIGSNTSATGAVGKSGDEFKSGAVAWLLQNGQTDSTVTVWAQKLLDQGDSVPVLVVSLSSKEAAQYAVYRVTFTAGETTEVKYQNTGGTVTVPGLPAEGGYEGWYIGDTKVEDRTITVGSSNITVTAKTQESTPSIAIDYENETLTGFAADAEYAVTIGGTAVALANGATTLSLKDYMGQTVSIVRKGGDGSVDSAAQSLTIPARPDKPTGLLGKNETVDGKADGKITGVTAAMEYKLSADDAWTACGGTEVTGLAPGEYQVRIAATDDSFAGTAADVAIATGAARTYTLNVTAPTFDSPVYYGYDRPAARAITIFNTGNSTSTISGVALSGENAAAFELNKTDGAAIQPGATDNTTYTIRPAAGLDAGAYTAAITVTYQDSMTAWATVSFTVIQAAQDAPTDAPAVKSKTYNSVTLETVQDNANGTSAQYGISADGENWTWQDSPAFTGLSASTAYTFAVRYGAAGSYAASEPGPTTRIATSARSSGGGSSSPTYTPTVERDDNGSASVSPKNPRQGDKVTITPKPNAGYETSGVTVTGKNGKTVKVTDNGDGTYSYTQPASKVTVEVTFTEVQNPVKKLPFTDASESAYYYDAVAWAVKNGIAAGTTATTFSPNAACTRAQTVTFLWRAAGSPAPKSSTNPFTDAKPGAYYYDAVLWAVEQGITTGTTATTFSPNVTVTRGQTVTFQYRAAGSPAANGGSFADVADSAYYASAVRWAVANGITNGTTAATFSPDTPCTRAQIVTFLYRAKA